MDYIAQPKDYWIAPNAVNITLNALGNPNRMQGSVASGAAILCYIEGVDGLGYDNGHRFRTWPLTISPTYFNSNTAKYVYVAIPRSTSVGTQAVVVFPSEKLDIYGKNADDAQVGSLDYYYIWLQAIISSSGSYGNVNRVWSQAINFGKKGTDEDLYDDTEGEWYLYSKVSELVTFLKPIFMKAGSYFQNLILGDKELTGVATAATGDEYIDSETLVVTPSYLHDRYLSRHTDDYAEGEIGFLKGLWVGVKGLYEITANGIAKLKSLFVDDITAQRMQVEDMQSSNYTGDSITDTGWRLTNDHNGHSKLTIDELYVRMKAVFESLEVKKEMVTGGNQIFSRAANVICRTDYYNGSDERIGYSEVKVPWMLRGLAMVLSKRILNGIYSKVRAVRISIDDPTEIAYIRCYFLAEEGGRKVNNLWQGGSVYDGNDLARCQTFNLNRSERRTYVDGEDVKYGNVFWWRKVVGVSSNSNPVEIDGKKYHYFDVSNLSGGYMTGSDLPCAGDEVSQWGNDANPDRMNLVTIEVDGGAAIRAYEGIYTFDMSKCWYGGNPCKMNLSPQNEYRFTGRSFKIETEYGVRPVPVDIDVDWASQTNSRAEYPETGISVGDLIVKNYYYDRVPHNGSLWLCLFTGNAYWARYAQYDNGVISYVTEEDFNTLSDSQKLYVKVNSRAGLDDNQVCRRQEYTGVEPGTSSAVWKEEVAKGEKGENTIRLDLDNEYDSIQYQGDGVTKVSPSGTVQTTAYLFDGVTDKSADATFTISNRTGMSDQQATISGRVVTVSGLSSDGEVTVRAEYPTSSGKYYYAKFAVKKLIGIDKYDLVVMPNAVPVNTSNTVADTALSVQVYRTPSNGGTRHLVQFTNKTTNDYGLTLSVKDSLNNSLTETTGTGKVTTRTFNLTGTMATNADNVMIVLTKDSKTQDSETIPITHVHNGIDGSGSNAVKIDLDNEMDSIPCDSDGKVMSQTVLEVNARIYDGAAPVSSGVAVGSVGAIAGVSAVTSVTNGVVNIKWTIPATGSGTPLSVDKYTSQIVLTWGGHNYYATFTANVVKSGEPGVSPTIFQLLPEPSQILFKRNSSGVIPSSTQTLSLSIKETDENGTSVITVAASGLTVRYRTDQAPSSASDGTAWPSAGLSVSSSVTYGNVYIAAFDGNGTLIDRETVAIVKDGENGTNGSNGDTPMQAYQWNSSSTSAPTPLPSGANLGLWSATASARPSTAGDHFLWMTQTVKHTATDGTVTYDAWSPATRVSPDTGPQGEPGSDAVNIVISPSSLIVNQDLNNPDNLSDLTQTFVIKVYKGDVEQTVNGISFVSEIASTSPTTKYKALFLNGGGQRSGNSNIAGNILTLKQINTYTQDGKTLYYDSMYANVTATYNTNKTITARIRIYANLLGTWAETVEGGVRTITAELTRYLEDENGDIITSQSLREDIDSAEQSISTLQGTVTTQGTSITNLNTRVSTAEGNVSKVSKTITGSNDNLVMNGAFIGGIHNWSAWGSPAVREIVSDSIGRKWMHVVSTTSQFEGYQQRHYSDYGIKVTAGEKYTISLRARSASGSATIAVGFHWFVGNSDAYSSQSWVSFSVNAAESVYSTQVTVPSGIDNFSIMVGDATDTSQEFYITEIKMELGEIATAWSDNRSDSYSEIRQTADNIDMSIIDMQNGLEAAGVHLDGQNSEINIIADRVNFKMPDGTANAKVSIDPTTGTLHAVDGNFEGTVKAKTLFRSYQSLMLSYSNTDTFQALPYVCDLNLYMNGKRKRSNGTYEEITPQFTELPDVLFVGCRTPYGTGNGESKIYTLSIPLPEHYQGRQLDIYGEQNMGLTIGSDGAVTGHSYAVVHIQCAEDGSSNNTRFVYPFSTTPHDAVFYFNDRFYGDDVHYAHLQLISSYINDSWLWAVVNKDYCHSTNFDFN